MRDALGSLAGAQYRSGGLDPSLALLFSDDPDDYLDKAAVARPDQRPPGRRAEGTPGTPCATLAQERAEAAGKLAELEKSRKAVAPHKRTVEQKLAEARAAAQLPAGRRARRLRPRLPLRPRRPCPTSRGAVPASRPRGRRRRRRPLRARHARTCGAPTGPSGFDCSGLMQWAYAQAGVALPRTSQAQRYAGRQVPLSQARPGDLVAYRSDASHVGMYVGNGQVDPRPLPGRAGALRPGRHDAGLVGHEGLTDPRAGRTIGNVAGRGRASRIRVVALLPAARRPGRLRRAARARTLRAAEVQRVLDRRAAAVLDRDRAGLYRAPPGAADRVRRGSGTSAVSRWPPGRTASPPSTAPAGAATADAELRYRLKGYDKAPVTAGRTLRLTRDDGQVVRGRRRARGEGRRAAVGPGRGAGRTRRAQPRPRGRAAGGGAAGLRGAGGPRRAGRVRGVGHRLGGAGRGARTEVAGGDGGAARRAGRPRTGGSPRSPPARRAARRRRPRTGSSSTPTRTACSATSAGRSSSPTRPPMSPPAPTPRAATPLWLSEGYADWVGYRGTGRTPAEVAPELQRAVRGRAGAGRACRPTRTSASPGTRGSWRRPTRAAGWPAG